MYPEAGGSSSFTRHAFNELVSFIAAWGQMLNYTITVAISAYFVPHYLAVFWQPLGHAPGDVIGGAVLIAALAVLNIRGSQESAKLSPSPTWRHRWCCRDRRRARPQPPGPGRQRPPRRRPELERLRPWHRGRDDRLHRDRDDLQYGEEAKDASRTIPLAAGLVVAAVLGLYLLIPVVALSAMPVTQSAAGHYMTALGTQFANDPILGIVENLGLGSGLTEALRYYVGVLAAVILLIATNAGLIGVSRLAHSMGQHRQLPEVLRQVHPRYRTPHIAIMIFSVIAVIMMIPGKTDFLATLYPFGAMLSFTIAHVAVIQLRRRKAGEERPWKPPFNVPLFGTDVPLTALFGGLGTFAAWIVVMALNPRTLAVGAGWMVLGVIVYVLHRRNQRLPLTETVKVLLPEPLGVEEIDYRSVLVAFEEGEPFSEEMVATAAKLASKRRRGIHIHAMITVPTNLLLNAEMPEQDAEAQSKVEQAKLIGGQRVTGHLHRVRPGQAGKAIAEEAKMINAAAVVVGLRYRNRAPLYDKTLQTVLGERPCRVIVVSDRSVHPGAEATPVLT
ncbi:MAG: amino acid permease [Solirubrobacterales bacterium]